MRDRVFVTGGSGFVGSRLIPALRKAGYHVTALFRQRPSSTTDDGVEVIEGDLLDPDSYRETLRSCRTVIHLAAATGRATADDHWRINADGTGALLDACRAADVTNILFVSSIAATFPDTWRYPYAEAKRRAERTVAQSGLHFTIVRPTIILGPGSPIERALGTLASLPVMLLPGDGRVSVQPIQVNDVVDRLVDMVRQNEFANTVVELGGADTLTMEALLQRVRSTRTGRTGRVWHLPLGLLRLTLGTAEGVGLGRLLPITAGQLASFRFDGVASPTAQLIMPGATECGVLTHHLLGCAPDAAVTAHYGRALTMVPELAPQGRFDTWLLNFARSGAWRTRLADAYASVFKRDAALRRRLVILLAILETSRATFEDVDAAVGGSSASVFLRMGLRGVGSLLVLLVSLLIFLPARLLLAGTGKGAR